ncbi:hypothetical protein EL84_25950 [Paenibacillus sp. VT-400]|uniref:DUF3102 domain-containing protein n=1 Tax=Paenibacillus sp. VT-400 TaxID=1495853 RepID=UPI00064A4436|nr:DUF3102 domain-containing protein [Paenibacillus sp. VT-400]KLU55488.1 hypothetical protein EL84_25950 [Paenibacillus sp. VT-400]
MTTNDLALSSDLPTLTAEINAYKRVAGEAIFEIGRRLKHIKETKLAEERGGWTTWCEVCIEMPVRHANKFVQIVSELGDRWSTSTTLAFEALYQIATLPPEERTRGHTVPSTGETKTVDEMTVRELREVKAALKAEREAREEAERQRSKVESDYETVRDTLESMREQPPQVEYVL